MPLTVLAFTILGAIGSPGPNPADDTLQAAMDPGAAPSTEVVSIVVGVTVHHVAFYCGGYVAGRMARFDGIRQGVAVCVWAVVIAVAVATLIAVSARQASLVFAIDGLPPMTITTAPMDVEGLIGDLATLAVGLIAAVLGGSRAMRFHRRIDRAQLDAVG